MVAVTWISATITSRTVSSPSGDNNGQLCGSVPVSALAGTYFAVGDRTGSSEGTSPGITNRLPPSLAPYASTIATILIFVDGLIFGVAIKKAIVSAIMVVAGLLLSGFVGLTLSFPSTNGLLTLLQNTLASQAQTVGPAIYALPVFFLIGVAVGFWKG